MNKITVPDIAERANRLIHYLENNGFHDHYCYGIRKEGQWSKDYARFSGVYPDHGNRRHFNVNDFMDDLAEFIEEYFYTDDHDIEIVWTDDELIEVCRIAPSCSSSRWSDVRFVRQPM